MPYRVYRARIELVAGAHRMGQQRRSIDALNALFDPDLGYDAGPWEDDPRRAVQREQRLIEALAVPGAWRG